MSDVKLVTWFADDPKPNAFFSRSPFCSWQFIVNSVLVLANIVSVVLIAWKYWGEIAGSFLFSVLSFLLASVIYPYWRAIIRHGRIYEMYCSEQLRVESVDSPLDRVLNIADDSMNEGLSNTSFLSLLLLLVIVLCKLEHLR